MKKLLYLLPLILLSCEKPDDEPERNFTYKIAFTEYHNEEQTQAVLYYYDDSMKLLSYKNSLNNAKEVTVEYSDTIIDLGSNQYCYLDNDQQIKEYIENNNRTIFKYSNNRPEYLKIIIEDQIIQESFYTYSDPVILDSTVLYNNAGTAYMKILNTIHPTDTLCPAYKVHVTGIVDYPALSEFLIRNIEKKYFSHLQMPDSIQNYKYQYLIFENSISEYIDILNAYGDKIDGWHRSYTLLKK